jgi:hypothetical protein
MTKDLVDASQYIATNILLPIEELSHRAMYRLETAQAMHDMQVQLLDGISPSEGDAESKSVDNNVS